MKRLCNQNDFEAVYAIYMHETVIPYLGFDPMSKIDFKKVFDDLIRTGCFFVYELSSTVAAFVRVARSVGRCSHVAYVGTLAVAPGYQGQGIAKKLISMIIDELKQEGIKRIELIVESDNPKAISFYKKFGFEIEGTLKKFYKRSSDDHYVDDYLMALIVD